MTDPQAPSHERRRHSASWKPGQSGNPGGRPKTKEWRSALLRAVDEAARNGEGKVLDEIARATVREALNGNMHAIKEIGDRIDGRAVQEVTGPDGEGLFSQVKVLFVRPDGSNT